MSVFSATEVTAAFNRLVTCEKFESREVYGINTDLQTCFMDGETIIDELGTMISSILKKSVTEVFFDRNKNIEFLPENIYEKFPNIVSYTAWDCALNSVSKVNFKSLSKLRRLALNNNKIQRIESDTFEDLKALELLMLSKRKNNI